MKIRKIFKRVAAAAMAAVTALSIVPSSTVLAAGDIGTISFANAYDGAGNAMRYNSSANIGGYTAGGTGEYKYRMYVDGENAFCIQPGVPLRTGNTLAKASSHAWNSLSANQRKAVGLDRHRGSKIKTCPTGNTDISPCLLAPVCLIMECHILWKLNGNGISGITVQLRCPRHLLRAIIGCFQSGLAQTDLWIGRRRQAFQIIDPTKHPALPQIIHRASGKPIHAAVKITGRDMGEHIL